MPMLYTYDGSSINYVNKLDDSDSKQQQGGKVSYVSTIYFKELTHIL